MESATTRVLVVDDDSMIAEVLRDALSQDYLVEIAGSVVEADRKLGEASYQVAVTDVLLGGRSGLELLELTRDRYPEVSVIVITAYATLKVAIEALNKGARRFLLKPLDIKELRRTVDSLVDERTRRLELTPYTIGRSLVMPNDLSLVSAVARDVAEAAVRAGHPESFGFALRAILGEALPNAIIHGNLAVDRESERRDTKVIEKRLQDPSFSRRKLRVDYQIDDREAWIRIEDEGPGFDYRSLADPTDESKLLDLHGRGLFLMRQLADPVEWKGRGNIVEITKRAPAPAEAPTSRE